MAVLGKQRRANRQQHQYPTATTSGGPDAPRTGGYTSVGALRNVREPCARTVWSPSRDRFCRTGMWVPPRHGADLQPLPASEETLTVELTNLESVPGKTITRHLGLVQGSTVRSKHAGRDLLAGLKNFVGGELKAYTELLNESRAEAVTRMTQQATAIGANAVINIRFSTSNIASGAAEVMAYGTAVYVE